MTVIDEVKIVVRAEADAAIAKMNALDKTMNANTASATKTGAAFGGPLFSGVMKYAGPAGAALAAIKVTQSLISYAKSSLDAWAQQAEASALLGNVLKTTGAEAWTTQGHLEDLASSLQKTTKYGDETVTSMQTVLLGFRNITGKEFDHATEAVLDMATVMGMDLTSAAQAVGKALDIPGENLESLRKQGFLFTQEQKNMMKAMREAGDMAGAQKIILDELDKTFGGAAKSAGELDSAMRVKLQNAVGELDEEMGRAITATMAPYWRWLGEIYTKAAEAAKKINDLRDAVKNVDLGKATSKDFGLLIAEANKQLANYKKELLETSKVSPVYEGLQAQIAATEALIQDYEKFQRMSKTAEGTEARLANDAAEAAAEAAAEQKKNYDMITGLINERIQKYWDQEDAAAAAAAAEDLIAANIIKTNNQLPGMSEAFQEVARSANIIAGAMDGMHGQILIPDEDSISAWEKYVEEITKAQDETQILVDIAKVMQESYGDAFEAIGEALVTGEEGWKSLGQVAVNAIAGILEALGAELASKAALALVNFLMGEVTDLAAIAPAIAGSAAAYTAAGALRAIPMKEGGSGIAYEPTLFLAGEGGPEPYAFGGANNKRGMGVTQNIYIGGSIIAQRNLMALGNAGMARAMRGY